MSDTKAKTFSKKGMGSTDSLILQAMTGIWTVGIIIVLFTAVFPSLSGKASSENVAGVVIPPSSALASHMEMTGASKETSSLGLTQTPTDPSDINELIDLARHNSEVGDQFVEEVAFEQAEAHYLSAYSLLNKVKSEFPDRVGMLLNQVLYKRGTLYLQEGLYEAAKATFNELEENYIHKDSSGKKVSAEDLGNLYHAQGIIYRQLGEAKLADSYTQRAMEQFSLIPKASRTFLDQDP